MPPLPLPRAYDELVQHQLALDTSMMLFRQRQRTQQPSFADIKSVLEQQSGRAFCKRHLAQIMTIFGDGYRVARGGAGRGGHAEPPLLVELQLPATATARTKGSAHCLNGALGQRQRDFRRRLEQRVACYHARFLRALEQQASDASSRGVSTAAEEEKAARAATVAFAAAAEKATEEGGPGGSDAPGGSAAAWHPSFPLNRVPDVPAAALPAAGTCTDGHGHDDGRNGRNKAGRTGRTGAPELPHERKQREMLESVKRAEAVAKRKAAATGGAQQCAAKRVRKGLEGLPESLIAKVQARERLAAAAMGSVARCDLVDGGAVDAKLHREGRLLAALPKLCTVVNARMTSLRRTAIRLGTLLAWLNSTMARARIGNEGNAPVSEHEMRERVEALPRRVPEWCRIKEAGAGAQKIFELVSPAPLDFAAALELGREAGNASDGYAVAHAKLLRMYREHRRQFDAARATALERACQRQQKQWGR